MRKPIHINTIYTHTHTCMRLCNRTANKAECCLHINNFAFTAAFSADRNVKAAVGKKKRERERGREK